MLSGYVNNHHKMRTKKYCACMLAVIQPSSVSSALNRSFAKFSGFVFCSFVARAFLFISLSVFAKMFMYYYGIGDIEVWYTTTVWHGCSCCFFFSLLCATQKWLSFYFITVVQWEFEFQINNVCSSRHAVWATDSTHSSLANFNFCSSPIIPIERNFSTKQKEKQ